MIGLVTLTVGAELLTRGGARLAALVGIPPIIIGLTIVALGTSTPELAVGIEAALEGSGSLAVGNIAGTNTFNILFILGISALLLPLDLDIRAVRFDLPVMTAAAVTLMLMASDGLLTRTEGAVLVAAAVVYTFGIIRSTRRESRAVKAEFAGEYRLAPTPHPMRDVASSFAVLMVGIAIVVVGAKWLVDGAVDLARMLGVSDAFIGLTVVAIGTSSPEFVTTVVSTLRQQRDIAVGNLIGSSTYNILFILGATAIVPPDGIAIGPGLVRIDIPIMALVTLACVPVFLSGHRVTRWEGGLFVAAYLTYLTYVILVHN